MLRDKFRWLRTSLVVILITIRSRCILLFFCRLQTEGKETHTNLAAHYKPNLAAHYTYKLSWSLQAKL